MPTGGPDATAGEVVRKRDRQVVRALDAADVVFVEENGGGPGVRLRK
jgi:hypothetical protein